MPGCRCLPPHTTPATPTGQRWTCDVCGSEWELTGYPGNRSWSRFHTTTKFFGTVPGTEPKGTTDMSNATTVTEYLTSNPGTHSAAEVATATGLERKAVSSVLSKLAKKGDVVRPEEGRYAAAPAAEAQSTPEPEPTPEKASESGLGEKVSRKWTMLYNADDDSLVATLRNDHLGAIRDGALTVKVGRKWTNHYDADGTLVAELRNDHADEIKAYLA